MFDWNMFFESIVCDKAVKKFNYDVQKGHHDDPILGAFLQEQNTSSNVYESFIHEVRQYINPRGDVSELVQADLDGRRRFSPEVRFLGNKYLDEARSQMTSRLKMLLMEENLTLLTRSPYES